MTTSGIRPRAAVVVAVPGCHELVEALGRLVPVHVTDTLPTDEALAVLDPAPELLVLVGSVPTSLDTAALDMPSCHWSPDTHGPPAPTHLVDIEAPAGEPPARWVDELLDLAGDLSSFGGALLVARRALDEDRVVDAIDALAAAEAIRPGTAQVLNAMAVCANAQGLVDDAVALLRSAVAVNPSYRPAARNLAVLAGGAPDRAAPAVGAPPAPVVLRSASDRLSDGAGASLDLVVAATAAATRTVPGRAAVVVMPPRLERPWCFLEAARAAQAPVVLGSAFDASLCVLARSTGSLTAPVVVVLDDATELGVGHRLDATVDGALVSSLARRAVHLADVVVWSSAVAEAAGQLGVRPAGRVLALESVAAGALADAVRAAAAPPVDTARRPTVSVVIAHHDRPATLVDAVASALEQTERPHEIVVVDDGSRTPQAAAVLAELERLEGPVPVRVVRTPNRYLGAARNAGARAATGEVVAFCDDDDVLRPDHVERLVTALIRTGAAAAVAAFDVRPAGHDGPVAEVWPFVGDVALDSGAAWNTFGGASIAVRREVLVSVGGFHEHHGVGHEDWALLARLSLRGLGVVPSLVPTYVYRRSPTSMIATTRLEQNMAVVFDEYRAVLPPALAAWPAVVRAAGDVDGLHRRLAHAEQVCEQLVELVNRQAAALGTADRLSADAVLLRPCPGG